MEIEKKRETSWKIQLKNEAKDITLTSVEVSGDVRAIKLMLFNEGSQVVVEMDKEEFFNFLSILSAFRDVVIGDDSLILEEELTIIEDTNTQSHSFSASSPKTTFNVKETPEPREESNDTDEESEELNPEEWDPW